MLEKLVVGLRERSYPIWIGEGILDRLTESLAEVSFPKRVAVVSNPTVQALYGERLLALLNRDGYKASPISIPDGEKFKTLATLESIYDALIQQGFDRSSGLIALGGGVIGDITGFAAATFLRGVPFVQVPTTLLAQVDSSVGGKTAVNHPLGKNLIGAFYQPRHVHIDVNTLTSLPQREFSAGMAEVIKYGIIRDRDFFTWLAAHRDLLFRLDQKSLIQTVKRSCQIKANVVESDEKEHSLRAILNYGHTFGHAVEALTEYGKFRHGEAVAIGMVVAAEVSCRLGHCSREDADGIRDLTASFNLPVTPPLFPVAHYLQAMRRDKKVKEGVLRFVLNRSIGECFVTEVREPEPLFSAILSQLTARG